MSPGNLLPPLQTEIDLAGRPVAGDVFHFEIQNFPNQAAKDETDASRSTLAETRRSLCRTNSIDARIRRVLTADDHHGRAVETADPIEPAKIEFHFRPTDHLFEINSPD